MDSRHEEAMVARLLPEVGLFWFAAVVYLLRWVFTGSASTRYGWALLIVFGPSLLLLLRALSRDRRLQQAAQ